MGGAVSPGQTSERINIAEARNLKPQAPATYDLYSALPRVADLSRRTQEKNGTISPRFFSVANKYAMACRDRLLVNFSDYGLHRVGLLVSYSAHFS